MSENNVVRITRVFTSRQRAKDAVQLVRRLKIASSIRVCVHADSIYLDLLVEGKNEAIAKASTNFGEDIDADTLPPISDCSEVYVGVGVIYFKKQQPYSRS